VCPVSADESVFLLTARGVPLDDVDAAYRRYFALIREKCRRMLADFAEADDVAQETFVRLWSAKLDSSDSRRVVGWIYRTATRLAVDRLRERSRVVSVDSPGKVLAQLEALAPGSDDALATRSSLAAIARRLPPEELEVALLSRLDGLTQMEIAELSGVSERTVRRRLRKLDARVAKLRKELVP
jgi:RNA polymerase sigma-70 factor (ECF subfamily)